MALILCVILRLAILVQCRLVTDGQTDGHTHDDSCRSCYAVKIKLINHNTYTHIQTGLFMFGSQNYKIVKCCINSARWSEK